MSERKDDIEKYRRGELSPSQRHELEKKALFDPFLADALDGTSSIDPEDLSADLNELKRKIKKEHQPIFTPIRIAAGVVLLIGVSMYLFWPSPEVPMLTQQEPPTESSSTATDSVKVAEVDSAKQQLALTKEPESKVTNTDSENSKVKKTRPVITPVTKQPEPTVAATESEQAITREGETADSKMDTTAIQVAGLSKKKEPSRTRVSGNVTVAEDGLPLPGVNVTVKGTSLGTTTDINGDYTLNVPEDASLVFSFVGMVTSEVGVKNKDGLNVKMNEDVSQLSEVVITRNAIPRRDNEGPVVKLAEPVGGIKAYDKYMEDNLRYPQQAIDNNVKGRVVVEFSIGTDGELNNFVVMRSLGFGCDDEVIRLVKEGPQWRPTTEDSSPVVTSVRVRMKFDPAKAKAKKRP